MGLSTTTENSEVYIDTRWSDASAGRGEGSIYTTSEVNGINYRSQAEVVEERQGKFHSWLVIVVCSLSGLRKEDKIHTKTGGSDNRLRQEERKTGNEQVEGRGGDDPEGSVGWWW